MLASIYPIIFLSAVAAAAVWYYNSNNHLHKKITKLLFFIATGLYIPTVLFISGSFVYKTFLVIPRDLLVFVAVIFLANRLSENKKRFIAVMGILAVATGLFYFKVLQETFVYNKGIDPNAELLFDIKNHSDLNKIKQDLSEYNLDVSLAFPNLKHPEYSALDEYYTVNIPDNHAYELENIMTELKETGFVDWVERNEILTLSPLEKETQVFSTDNKIDYGINDPELGKLWGFKQMKVDKYYKFLKKSKIKPKKKAKIAILDTGVDGSHEDLNKNFTSTKKKFNKDVQGHGTHCAGIAGSVSNNKLGIASIIPSNKYVEITSIKVLSDRGSGTQKGIIDGMMMAADQGVDVLSMSLGGRTGSRIQKAYDEAIKYVNKSGGIVVVAAGNSNENAKFHSPANSKGAIVVTAVDEKLKRASFSNHIESITMGIAAPGVNIYSTFPNNKYVVLNGTSMATPYVAGLLGIMKALNPNLTTKEAYKILSTSGIATGNTKKTGKFIQPLEAIKALKQF